jgi:hypothetical protein
MRGERLLIAGNAVEYLRGSSNYERAAVTIQLLFLTAYG